ncbi:MAG: DUF302 domain-containing protein [Thermoleophilia bacterium]|nr:DUF302 domain-containing protein [Thermoleophilia bacterium]
MGLDEAVGAVIRALAGNGFGVLTTIDVAATLRARLGVDVPGYVILGACNPTLAHRGLDAEPDLGVLLPCNVVVREEAGGTVISAMDPVAALSLAGNPALEPLAAEARVLIERSLASLDDAPA